MKITNFKLPNTHTIMFGLIIFSALLTWIIPSGEFERIEVDGRILVENESYQSVEKNPQGIGGILTAPIKGFIDSASIIGFVLIVGGAFGVFQRTKAVDSAIRSIAAAHKKYNFIRLLLIPIFMTIFSLGGAIFGMSEEVIPFILFFVPMSILLGYDTITGVAIPFIGAGAGFAGAFINPFTLGIAQGIAGLEILSGMGYRIIVWFVITAAAIIYVMRYAAKIRKDKNNSPIPGIDNEWRKKNLNDNDDNQHKLESRHKFVLAAFFAGLIVMVFGVLNYGWFIEEICAVFLITGIIVGIIGKLNSKEITEAFISGAKDLTGTALIIALAKGIKIVADEGRIIDTILSFLSSGVSEFHPVISGQVMFFVQSFLNFFVPSGSGQAALTMPVMAPLADLVGVSRQTAVLAFQFGDGFSNMIIPTSAVTMGILSLAKIPWEKWALWILPLQVIFIILSMLLLIPPYFINW